MKEILFNGLKIKMNINSIAISIGNIDIYWYAIFIVLAFVVALVLLKKDENRYDIKFEDVLELFILIIPVSIVCSRLYFIIFKLDEYIQNPIKILNIRNGGLAIYGGIIGGFIVTSIFCKSKKIKLLNMLDYIVPYIPLRSSNRKMGQLL